MCKIFFSFIYSTGRESKDVNQLNQSTKIWPPKLAQMLSLTYKTPVTDFKQNSRMTERDSEWQTMNLLTTHCKAKMTAQNLLWLLCEAIHGFFSCLIMWDVLKWKRMSVENCLKINHLFVLKNAVIYFVQYIVLVCVLMIITRVHNSYFYASTIVGERPTMFT